VGGFSRFDKVVVRDGSMNRFWHDMWYGNHPLKVTLLKLFSIACCKETLVADHMQFLKGNLQRSIYFSDQCKIRRWT
jgi:hypothetical protein